MSSPKTATTTVTMSPPKYQVTIPQEVRKVLEIDGEKAILEIDVEVVKLLDEDENRENPH